MGWGGLYVTYHAIHIDSSEPYIESPGQTRRRIECWVSFNHAHYLVISCRGSSCLTPDRQHTMAGTMF